MHLWSQNLTHDLPGGRRRPMIFHGRATLSDEHRPILRAEWIVLFTVACVLKLHLDRDERELTIQAGLPFLFLLFFSVPMARWLVARLPWKHGRGEYEYMGGDREIGAQVHDAALWLAFWRDTMEQRNADPWWYGGRLGLDDVATLLFGRCDVRTTLVEQRDVFVTMPEGVYRGVGTLELIERTRPRLPMFLAPRWRVVDLNFEAQPVPMPGKGENSWDCTEDAVYRSSMGIEKGETIEDVARRFEAKHLQQRERRGGARWRPGPRAA